MTDATPICTAVPTLLDVCAWCDGSLYEPEESAIAIPCGICEGGGWSPVIGDLGPTQTYRARPYVFNPGLRNLVVWRNGKRDSYTIVEFLPDALGVPSRAFRLMKKSAGAVYDLLVTADSVSCDCAGKTFETSAKSNARAYCGGGAMFPTAGCIHADAVKELLAHGLLDLPEPNATNDEYDSQAQTRVV